jgi:hypothetical protein
VTAHQRRFDECIVCGMIHVDPADHLSESEALAHYRLHQNDPGDARYRAFLDRLAGPLVAVLSPGAIGLDYGCGPGPTLSAMLRERGYPTAEYDPHFFPSEMVLQQDYDFITCSETAEHFADPCAEFARLFRMLRPHGVLGVMTEMVRDDQPIATWRYARDPTHVSFYRPRTMEWIATHFQRGAIFPVPNVVLFVPAAT